MKLRTKLLWLFPGAWRARYGDEFDALLEDLGPSPRAVVDVVIAALRARLSPLASTRSQPAGAIQLSQGGAVMLARSLLIVAALATPVATGAVGYYMGRSQVTSVDEPRAGQTTFYLFHGPFAFPVWGTLSTGVDGATRANLSVCGASRVSADGMFYWDTHPCP
jgi:hypothetical protein